MSAKDFKDEEPFEYIQSEPMELFAKFKYKNDYDSFLAEQMTFQSDQPTGLAWALEAIDRPPPEAELRSQMASPSDAKAEKTRKVRQKAFLRSLESAGVHGVIVDQTGLIIAGTSKWARRIEASTTLRVTEGKLNAFTARSAIDLQAGLGVLSAGYQVKHVSVPLRTLDGWVIDMVRMVKCDPELGDFVTVLLPKTAQDEMSTVTGLQVFAGLTKSEANIATLLAQARMIDEIAAIRKTSVATVKSQIKGLLAKLGLRRQADLVRLISTAR
jgi:DNA-binding CsgD family transcriptional regulator